MIGEIACLWVVTPCGIVGGYHNADSVFRVEVYRVRNQFARKVVTQTRWRGGKERRHPDRASRNCEQEVVRYCDLKRIKNVKLFNMQFSPDSFTSSL